MKKKNLKKVATQKVTENERFHIMAIWKYLFSVIVIIFAAIMFFGGSHLPEKKATASDWSENRLTIKENQAFQAFIESFETEFGQFRELALSKLAKLPDDEMRANLVMPFDLFETNRLNNPNRNIYSWIKKLQAENTAGRAEISDRRFFNYGVQGVDAWGQKMEQDFLASFTQATRTIYLKVGLKKSDLFGMLVFYHEMVHCLQDTSLRFSIDSDEKEKTYQEIIIGDKPTIIIDFELEAYFYELMLLDQLLDGQFSQGYKQSKPMSRTELGQKLNVLPTEQEFLRMLIKFGEYVFCDKQNIFYGELIDFYRQKDYRILTIENLEKFKFRQI